MELSRSPTLLRTIESLKSRILSDEFGRSGILPSIETLATQSGVSLVTAWKAVQALKQDGLLIGKRGSPLMVAEAARARPKSDSAINSGLFPQPKLKWLHLSVLIKRDLLNSTLRPGRLLPSSKELMRLYAVSYPTLRKTLAALAEEGLLQPCSGGFRAVPLRNARPGRNRIVLVTQAESLGRIYSGVLFVELLKTLEEGCRSAQVALDIVSYRCSGGNVEFCYWPSGDQMMPHDDGTTLGFIFAPESTGDEREEIARRLLLPRVPLAIFDDQGSWHYSPKLLGNQLTRVFRLGISGISARIIARYLLDMGHQSVAFLSPFQGTEWSQARYVDLVNTFSEAGASEGVKDFVLHLSGIDFLESLNGVEPIRAFSEFYARWRERAPSAYVRQFEPFLDRLLSVESAHAKIRIDMEPLFAEALRDKTITAWVAVNDTIAGFATDFCRKQGVSIPSHLSIIGFDDMVDALRGDMTSYNHNIGAIADAILRHLFQQRDPLVDARQKIVDIEGSLAIRGSSAPPRKR